MLRHPAAHLKWSEIPASARAKAVLLRCGVTYGITKLYEAGQEAERERR